MMEIVTVFPSQEASGRQLIYKNHATAAAEAAADGAEGGGGNGGGGGGKGQAEEDASQALTHNARNSCCISARIVVSVQKHIMI